MILGYSRDQVALDEPASPYGPNGAATDRRSHLGLTPPDSEAVAQQLGRQRVRQPAFKAVVGPLPVDDE